VSLQQVHAALPRVWPHLCCVRLFALQLPSFDHIRFVSLLGALMSAAYCIIAVVMSATVKPGPEVNYSPAAVARSPVERVMGIFNALTTVLFAYGGHNVALEIQATIPVGGKHPLSTVPAMMRGVNVTFVVTGACAIPEGMSQSQACITACASEPTRAPL
jgi:hypothetical protein